MHDFMTVETVQFPKGGGQTTPGHSFSDFTFRYRTDCRHFGADPDPRILASR
jgi:hypothetical protein